MRGFHRMDLCRVLREDPDGSALGRRTRGAAWPVVDITTTAVNATANTPAPTTMLEFA